MSQKTLTCGLMEADTGYVELERLVAQRIAGLVNTQLFETDATGLWEAYLGGIDEQHRQHYNCHACRRFVERYGGLAIIDDDHEPWSPLWHDECPTFFEGALKALFWKVNKARVTGVFFNDAEVWGTPKTGEWSHLSGRGVPVFKHQLKTPSQAAAEKREEHGMLRRGMAEYPRDAVFQAVRVLEADAVDRSEKTLGLAKWLLALHDLPQKGRQRDNLIWAAVAKAPPGWCHVKTTMIGPLLDDVVQGLEFDAIKRRWDAKMHPLRYQRPQTISDGQIEAANKIVEKLGAQGALSRRFAKLTDVLKFEWQPQEPLPTEEPKRGGAFDHLRKKPVGVKPVQLPPKQIDWVKFAAEVLPTARSIECMAPISGGYYGLVTAVDPEAPAIIQWDGLYEALNACRPGSDEPAWPEGTKVPLPRNPVSWYFHHPASHASQWNLTAGAWVKVTGIFLKPHLWQRPDKFKHQGGGVFLALEGAKDMRNERGGGLFPEILKADYHAVRHAIEAHARQAVVAGKDEGDANGICLERDALRLRVDGQEHLVSWKE